jgi:hypothetical protein
MTIMPLGDDQFTQEFKQFAEQYTGWNWANIRRYGIYGMEFGQKAWLVSQASASARIAELENALRAWQDILVHETFCARHGEDDVDREIWSELRAKACELTYAAMRDDPPVGEECPQ